MNKKCGISKTWPCQEAPVKIKRAWMRMDNVGIHACINFSCEILNVIERNLVLKQKCSWNVHVYSFIEEEFSEIPCEFEVFIGYWSWQIFDNGKYCGVCFFFNCFISQCQFVKGCLVIRKWLKVEYLAHNLGYLGYGTFLPLNSI